MSRKHASRAILLNPAAMPLNSAGFAPVVVAPTYNNALTLRAVLDRLDRVGCPVIVVNDGSTDATAEILAHWASQPGRAQRWVVAHAANRGKGAALLTGFHRATELGFTHAGTMDTDGQLAPEQLPEFFAAASAGPDALILGHRDENTPNLPRANVVAWYLSGLGFWLETGLVIHDTQCGLRVYPLTLFKKTKCWTRRFGFETELLARAMWAGYSLALIPVQCRYSSKGKQPSHLKPARDGIKGFFMHWALAIRRLLPRMHRIGHLEQGTANATPSLDHSPSAIRHSSLVTYTWHEWLNPLGILRRVRSSRLEQLITSAAFAHGAFLACMPMGGLQFVLLPYTSRRLRHNFWAALTGLLLLLPPIGSWLAWLSVQVGNAHSPGQAAIDYLPPVLGSGFWHAFSQAPLGWLGGSMLVGTVVHWLVIGGLFAAFWLMTRQRPQPPTPALGNGDKHTETSETTA